MSQEMYVYNFLFQILYHNLDFGLILCHRGGHTNCVFASPGEGGTVPVPRRLGALHDNEVVTLMDEGRYIATKETQ